jgi:hypothetical protein
MGNRFVNWDRRRGWRQFRVLSRVFLYLGILAAVAVAPVFFFTLTGNWASLWLLLVLLAASILFFSLHAFIVDKYRR